ncbi:MAG TPA: O-antigen ligase family protein [Baekduia sp.]|jgi:O-antigen ligase
MRLRLSLPAAHLLVAVGACLLAVMIGVVSGVDPAYGVLAAVGIGFVVVVIGDLAAGFAAMVLFAYMETLSTLQGLSLAKIAGIVIAGSWLAVMTSNRRDFPNPLTERPGLMYLLLLFIGWTAISIAWSPERGEAVSSVIRYALNVLLIPIGYTAVRSPNDVVRLFAVLVVGAGIAAVSGIVDAPAADMYDIARASGTAGDPNELAAGLIVGFWVAAAITVNPHIDSRGRVGALIVAGLCLLSITLSLSRGGLLGLAVAAFATMFVAGRWRAPVVASVLGIAALATGAFVTLSSSGAQARLTESGSGSGRTDLWTIALRMIDAHPFRGIGTGQYLTSSVHYLIRPGAFQRGDLLLVAPKIAHNTYLGTVAELGFIGGALGLAFVIACGGSAWLAIREFERQGDERLEILARGFLVGVIGYAFSLIFISENYKKFMWIVLALGPILLSVARRAGREADEAAASADGAPAPDEPHDRREVAAV